MRMVSIAILFSISLNCFSQDSVIVKKQKGLLFLSYYNYQYDWSGGEIKPLGFDDFFYPVEDFNTKLLLDKDINFCFLNGIRIEFIKNRLTIKKKATELKCMDTSRCYEFDRFYIIPVEMDYKLFNFDFENCRRNYYELQVKDGSRIMFEYLHMALLPSRIISLPQLEKKTKQ